MQIGVWVGQADAREAETLLVSDTKAVRKALGLARSFPPGHPDLTHKLLRFDLGGAWMSVDKSGLLTSG